MPYRIYGVMVEENRPKRLEHQLKHHPKHPNPRVEDADDIGPQITP